MDYKEGVKELGGTVLAHEDILRFLVLEAKRHNPEFEATAIAEFDSYLGTVVDQETDNREFFIKARNILTAMLRSPSVSDAKPNTFRRRFLDWLQRG